MTTISHATANPARDPGRLSEEAGVEFVGGRIVEKPVSIESSEVELTIGRLLGNEAARTREARVFPASMGFRCFPDDPSKFRKPDVSVVRADRLAGVDPEEGFIEIPPDLAVEVVSPNDLAYELAAKVQDYLANGFGVVWVVYPGTRTVVVHRPDGSANLLRAGDEITGGAALPAFRCQVGEFFAAAG